MHGALKHVAEWCATIADLAERHGCPPDAAVYPWLLQHRLIDADGTIRMTPDPTSPACDSLVGNTGALSGEGAGYFDAAVMALADRATRQMLAEESKEADLAAAERDLEIDLQYIVAPGPNGLNVALCLEPLQQLTRCKSYIEPILNSVQNMVTDVLYIVVGDRPELATFTYLYRMIDDTMEREYATYAKAHAGRLGPDAKLSFQIEMANRINLRLAQLVRERDVAMQVGGDPGRAGRVLALVAEKQAAIGAFARPKARIGD